MFRNFVSLGMKTRCFCWRACSVHIIFWSLAFWNLHKGLFSLHKPLYAFKNKNSLIRKRTYLFYCFLNRSFFLFFTCFIIYFCFDNLYCRFPHWISQLFDENVLSIVQVSLTSLNQSKQNLYWFHRIYNARVEYGIWKIMVDFLLGSVMSSLYRLLGFTLGYVLFR